MEKKKIELHLDCPGPGLQDKVIVTHGIPFAVGELSSPEAAQIVDETGARYATQNTVLATWDPERVSAKWLLVDTLLPAEAIAESRRFYIEYPVSREASISASGDGAASSEESEVGGGSSGKRVTVEDHAEVVTIDTGAVRLRVLRNRADFLQSVAVRKPEGWENVLTGSKAAYLYMSDGAGNCYDSITAAPAPSVTVEDSGPVRASLCVRGWLANESGVRFCPYILRIHAFAGRSDLRIFHTVIFVQNLEHVAITSMGLRLNLSLGRTFRYSAGGDDSIHMDAVSKSFHIRHLSDQEYGIWCDGKRRWGGRRAPGWFTMEGSEASVAVCLRDIWREFPKGIRAEVDGSIDLQLWPLEHLEPLSFPTRLKEQVIRAQTAEEMLEKLKRNATAAVCFKGFLGATDMPRTEAEGNLTSLKEAKAFAEKHLKDRDVTWGDGSCGKAAGLAKTHEFWLDFRAPAPELAEAVGIGVLGPKIIPGKPMETPDPTFLEWTADWARLIDTPPLVAPDPQYVCSTDAFRLLHPEDRERFPEIEEGLDKMFEACLADPVETCRLYGAINYGDMINSHARMHGPLFLLFKDEPGFNFTDMVGWMNNEANDVCENLWLGYARSGSRRYWEKAEAYSEHLEDVDTTHAHPTDPSWVGLIHYHNMQHWSGPPSPSHTQIHGYLLHYFLTGNRRALEVCREAADWALRHLEPAGHVSCRVKGLRREYTGPVSNLWAFYQASWEEAYGEAARKSLEFFLKAQRETGGWPTNLATGGLRGEGVIEDGPEEYGGGGGEAYMIYDALRITGDERIRRAVIACGDWGHREYYDSAHYGKSYGPGGALPPYYDHKTYLHPLMCMGLSSFWLAFAYELTGDDKYLGPLRELLEHFPLQAEDTAAFTGRTVFQQAGLAVQNVARAAAAVARAEAAGPQVNRDV